MHQLHVFYTRDYFVIHCILVFCLSVSLYLFYGFVPEINLLD